MHRAIQVYFSFTGKEKKVGQLFDDNEKKILLLQDQDPWGFKVFNGREQILESLLNQFGDISNAWICIHMYYHVGYMYIYMYPTRTGQHSSSFSFFNKHKNKCTSIVTKEGWLSWAEINDKPKWQPTKSFFIHFLIRCCLFIISLFTSGGTHQLHLLDCSNFHCV